MFKDAIKFMAKYRQQREQALSNEAPLRWFTADAESMATLFDETFGSDDENAEWSKLAEAGADTTKLRAVRTKIAMLAGFRHDLRGQFAVGEAHDLKTALDFDRHAVSELRAAKYRMDLLDMSIDVQSAGVKTL